MMMMMMMMIVDVVVKWFWKVPWPRKISYFLCSTRKRVRATKEIAVRRLHADNSYDDDNLAVVQVKIIN